jgi:hypothetical protein
VFFAVLLVTARFRHLQQGSAFLCGFLYLGWTDASVSAFVKVKHKFQKNS